MTRGGFASLSQEQFTVDASTVRNIDLPVGAAVELDVTVQGHGGHMVFVPRAGQSLEVVFLSAGSLKAERDFTKMLESIRVDG